MKTRSEILKYRRFLVSQNDKGQTIFDLLVLNKKKNKEKMNNLFGDEMPSIDIDYSQFCKNLLSDNELIAEERECLGVNIINILGNDEYKIRQNTDYYVSDVIAKIENDEPFEDLMIGCVITKSEYKVSKKGNPFFYITLSDNSGSVKVFCGEKTYHNFNHHLFQNNRCFVKLSNTNGFFMLSSAISLDDLPYQTNTCLVLNIGPHNYKEKVRVFTEILNNINHNYIGNGETIIYCGNEKTKLSINITSRLLDWLENEVQISFNIKQIQPKQSIYTQEYFDSLEEYEKMELNNLLWK